MKYWWLKKYKDLKLEYIQDLKRDVSYYVVMQKKYYERYMIIRDSDIDNLSEEDLLIFLYSILFHDKIKNNKILLVINRLLEVPDNSLPATNYSLMEMLDEIKNLKNIYPLQDKLDCNNIGACYNCLNVFYIDKIKYINKKGLCLCPYCKSHNIYFDNDFIPMDYNFLKLAKFYYGNTALGCSFRNLQKLLKKSIEIKNNDVDNLEGALIIKSDKDDYSCVDNKMLFNIKELSYKKGITSKEEMSIIYRLNECFDIIEKNMIKDVVIDTDIIDVDNRYTLYLSLILNIMDNLGRNQYLRKITLVCKEEKKNNIINNLVKTIREYKK